MIASLAAAAMLAKLPVLTGDFDHDGRPDRAELRKRGGGYELIVTRASAPRHPHVVFSMKRLGDFYLDKARPGRWKTACGKGYGPDEGHCTHRFVTLRGDTLDFGFKESSEAVALWTGKRFETVWLSD